MKSLTHITNYFRSRSRIVELLVIVLSLVVFYPTLKWFSSVFFGLYDYFNLFLLLIVLGLLVNKYVSRDKSKPILRTFQFNNTSFVLCLIGVILYTVCHKLIDINILSAICFFLYVYGLLGFYLDAASRRKAMIPMLLIAMTLPFGNIMDVYVGFPLRIVAVEFISSFFEQLGIQNVSADTIITVENNAAQIDFSCSGLKGLWASLLFYFVLTWLENLKIGLKWLLLLGLLVVLIISANVLRISIIVYLITFLNYSELASVIHAPLGIFGFAFACGTIYLLVRYVLPFSKKSQENQTAYRQDESISAETSSKLHQTGLIVILVGLTGYLLVPGSSGTTKAEGQTLNFTTSLDSRPLKLSKKEAEFFEDQGSIAEKYAFHQDSISGSFLIVQSSGWRGHHNPENCVTGGGLTINHAQTIIVQENFPVKWLTLNNELTACYWFQSKSKITDDFATRVWAEVRKEEKNWILVSVVFNKTVNLSDPSWKKVLLELNKSINNQLILKTQPI